MNQGHVEEDLTIYRPICILGTGRSGTTLFFRLLASHPSLAWFSNFTNRFPRLTWLATWSRILDVPWIGPHMRPEWLVTPRPSEAYRLYNYLTDRMFTQPQSLDAEPTPQVIDRYRRCVKAFLSYQGKERFVQKHTGFPRIEYLSSIFPDARFIHVARDGRAVANSMIRMTWWNNDIKHWQWGTMDPRFEEEYLVSGREPAVLAAIVWKTLMRLIVEAGRNLPPDRYLEVRYDRLIADPDKTMAEVTNFCELKPSALFKQRVSAVPLRNEDSKWKKTLTSNQIELVEKCLKDDLRRYGFTD